MSAKNRRPNDSSIWKTPFPWVGLLVAAAAVFAIVSTLTGDDTPADGVVQTAPVEVSGTPLPRLGDADTTIGTPAPTFTASTFTETPIDLGGDGVGRLYGFFAHWCPHCQAELPKVVDWLEAGSLPAGVEVVAISTAVDRSADNYPPSQWFAREHWPSIVVVDDEVGTLASNFGVSAYPFWVAVDADGNVVWRGSGGVTAEGLDALVETIAPTP